MPSIGLFVQLFGNRYLTCQNKKKLRPSMAYQPDLNRDNNLTKLFHRNNQLAKNFFTGQTP
jgi:hypothetical protein